MPLSLVLFLMLISIFLAKSNHKISKYSLISSFLILLISSTPFFSGHFIKPIENNFQTFNKQEAPLDYIVVLGCGHITNESMPALTQLQTCSLQRLAEALRVFQLHPEATIITSGYSGSDVEANAIKVQRAAVSLGIPQEKIISYVLPKDTEDEAKLISPLLINKQFALVTNDSLMPRAMKYFLNKNTQPIAAPTGFRYKDNGVGLLENLPAPSSLQRTSIAWYETLGQFVQWLKS